MRLNHIDIAVNDVSAARAFLETYFDLHCIAERGTVAIMRDDAGVIVALSNFGRAKEVTYPKGFHVGFFQNTKERVDEIFERLQADGYVSMISVFDGVGCALFDCLVGVDSRPDAIDDAVVLAAVKDASRRWRGGPKTGHP